MKQNYSIEHKKYLKKLKLKSFSVHLIRALVLVFLIGIWELCATLNIIDPFITSSPSRIIKQIGMLINDGSLWHHSWVTLYETILAF